MSYSVTVQRRTILGTFQYMAPEQLEGHEADHRTDIWAFGCVSSTRWSRARRRLRDLLNSLWESGRAPDDFSPTYFRNATAYGVSPRLRGDLVVNNLAGWAYAKGSVYIKSDGTPWRPLVHIRRPPVFSSTSV